MSQGQLLSVAIPVSVLLVSVAFDMVALDG